jgi:DNA-binding NarL/FixJ family response regulator
VFDFGGATVKKLANQFQAELNGQGGGEFARAILIISDSHLIRLGLKQLINEEHRAARFRGARTGAEAIAVFSQCAWDLVILDLGLPDLDGFAVLETICEMDSETPPRVLVMDSHSDDTNSERARHLGALGYISTNSGRPDLVRALRNLLSGRAHFNHLPEQGALSGADASRANLSAREYEVLLALARGKRNSEIAADLNLNGKTISTFKRRILNKLRISSTAQLVRYAVSRHLV